MMRIEPLAPAAGKWSPGGTHGPRKTPVLLHPSEGEMCRLKPVVTWFNRSSAVTFPL